MSEIEENDVFVEETPAESTTSDTLTTTTDTENEKSEESSVTIGDTETNFKFEDDLRTQTIFSVKDGQNINISNGYFLNVENTKLGLTISGYIQITAKNLFHIVNSFVLLSLEQTTLSYELATPQDMDSDSTFVLDINQNSTYQGSLNYQNLSIIGKIAVIIEDGKWELTHDSYIDQLTITDGNVDRINLNDHTLFINGEKWIQHPPVYIDKDTGYDSEGKPTLRTLKIVTSKTIPYPKDRYKSYMYFEYDKMELWLYCSRYDDLFCIIDKVPDKPVENMLYLTMDGGVYTYYNYKVIKLGEIEKDKYGNPDPEQLELLKQVGTQYFMNAEARFIDKQTRTLQLPFQNGNYILSLDLGNDLKIDKDTIIRFDPSKEQFYIAGKEFQPDDRLNNIGKYVGYLTDTAHTSTEEGIFRVDVNISSEDNNGIEIADTGGLFVDTSELASESRYEKFITSVRNYMTTIDSYVNELSEAVQKVVGVTSEDTINEKIMDALVEYESTIKTMLEKYDEFYKRIQNLENKVGGQLDIKVDNAKQEIKDFVNQCNSAWSYFTGGISEKPTKEQLYFQKMIIEDFRNQIKEIRKNKSKLVVVKKVEELPTKEHPDTTYYLENADRTYTSFIWDIDKYIAGETTVPYADTFTNLHEDQTQPLYLVKDPEYPDIEPSYNSYGLTGEEQECLDKITAELNTVKTNEELIETYDSYYLLPTYGDESKIYIVFNIDRKIFRVYEWNNEEIDTLFGDKISEAGYRLIYDFNSLIDDTDPRYINVLTEDDINSVINNEKLDKYDSIHLMVKNDITTKDIITIPKNKVVYFELGDYKITSEKGFADVYGSLSISGNENSEINSQSTEDLITIRENGNVTSSVNLISGGKAVVISDNIANFALNGNAYIDSKDYSIYATGNNDYISIATTLIVQSAKDYAIYSTGNNSITIQSGEIYGIYIQAGELFIYNNANVHTTEGSAIVSNVGVVENSESDNKDEPVRMPSLSMSILGKVASEKKEAISIYKYDTNSAQNVTISIAESAAITSADGLEKYKVYDHDEVATIVGEGYDPKYDSTINIIEPKPASEVTP